MVRFELVRDSDLCSLADAVLTVLEQVGILCQNEGMREALGKWGAEVDASAETVRFPRGLVTSFVDGLRQERPPVAATGSGAFPASVLPGLGTQVAQFVHDQRRGEIRPGNRAELIALTKFGDVLGDGASGHCLLLRDVPPLLEPLEAGLILAEYAHRPGAPFAWHVSQVDYLLEMGEILGIPDWFSWGASCFAHPLRLDRDVADKFLRRALEGGSVGFTQMPVGGVSTPITTAGFVVVSAAEQLATWMAGRALNPRVALSGSMWGGAMDMASGSATYFAFDGMRNALAFVEFMQKWTGVELSPGGADYCSAKVPGYFAAWEKAYKAMTIAAFSGRNPGVGSGMVADGKILSPVQLLLEREVGLGLNLYSRPVEVSDDTLALPVILDVGFGLHGSYLQQEHTLRHFRDDTWLPSALDRSGYAGGEWEARVLDRLQDKVEEMLRQYRKPEGREPQLEAMRRVVERARQELLTDA